MFKFSLHLALGLNLLVLSPSASSFWEVAAAAALDEKMPQEQFVTAAVAAAVGLI
jgi:hypothetical protein